MAFRISRWRRTARSRSSSARLAARCTVGRRPAKSKYGRVSSSSSRRRRASSPSACGRAPAGIAAFFSPVGVHTVVAGNKERRTIDGRDYILETALRPDFGLVRAEKADRLGNLYSRGSTLNFHLAVAAASRVTIAEVDEIVRGGLDRRRGRHRARASTSIASCSTTRAATSSRTPKNASVANAVRSRPPKCWG